jgi:hypothetical protein
MVVLSAILLLKPFISKIFPLFKLIYLMLLLIIFMCCPFSEFTKFGSIVWNM